MTSNMAVTLDAMGRVEEAVQLRADIVPELSRQLGDDHPLVRIALSDERFRRELEPMSV